MLNKQKIKNFIANLTREEAILCDTEKYADEILEIANKLGYKWSGRDTTSNNWDVYKERTCYYFNPEQSTILYGSKEYAEKENLIFHNLNVFKGVALVELMDTVEQTKNALKNINYSWNIDEANITEKQKIKLITDGQLKLKFTEENNENPNLIILYHNDSLWLYDKHSQVKYIFRADKEDENIIINYNQYDLNSCDFENLIELLGKVENLFNKQVEKVKYNQAREFSNTIQAYNKIM